MLNGWPHYSATYIQDTVDVVHLYYDGVKWLLTNAEFGIDRGEADVEFEFVSYSGALPEGNDGWKRYDHQKRVYFEQMLTLEEMDSGNVMERSKSEVKAAARAAAKNWAERLAAEEAAERAEHEAADKLRVLRAGQTEDSEVAWKQLTGMMLAKAHGEAEGKPAQA